MIHKYFVCAAVNTENKTDTIISTSVMLEHKDNVKEGNVAKQLIEKIPRCQAIINFWEYED